MHPLIAQTVLPPVLWGVAGCAVAWFSFQLFTEWDYAKTAWYPYYSDGYCNVAVLPVVGTIGSAGTLSPEDVEGAAPQNTDVDVLSSSLRQADLDPTIAGIVLRIESYGGYPAASQHLMEAVESLQKPVVALIREAGTSGAYMAALGADRIIAYPFAEVGSIGITSSYVSFAGEHERAGREFVELSSAPFKDTGNPDKPLDTNERTLLEEHLAAFHNIFVDIVATYRTLPHETAATLANGAALPAAQAFAAGLIDEVGTSRAAQTWLSHAIGAEAILCE